MLEKVGWAERLSPRKLLRFDSWENDTDDHGNLSGLVEDPTIWTSIFPADEIQAAAISISTRQAIMTSLSTRSIPYLVTERRSYAMF